MEVQQSPNTQSFGVSCFYNDIRVYIVALVWLKSLPLTKPQDPNLHGPKFEGLDVSWPTDTIGFFSGRSHVTAFPASAA